MGADLTGGRSAGGAPWYRREIRSVPLVTFYALAALSAWLLGEAGVLPALRFVRERVVIQVRPSEIDVDGLYVFENPLPFKFPLRLDYPFPADNPLPDPGSVSAVEAEPATGEEIQPLVATWFRSSLRISFAIPGRGTKHVRVRYRQPARGSRGSYILTTTRLWRRPLKRGEFLLAPRGVRITASNYPLLGEGPYTFTREDFMPEREWEFAWVRE